MSNAHEMESYYHEERDKLQAKVDKLIAEYEVWSAEVAGIIARKHEENQRLRAALHEIGFSTEEAAILRARAKHALGRV